VDPDRSLLGVVTRNQLLDLFGETPVVAPVIPLAKIATQNPIVAFADEPLRIVVNRMAESGFTRFPVLDPHEERLVGMVSLYDLLHARARNLEDERARERVLRIRMPFGRQGKSREVPLTEGSDFPG
jgi:chloride channel protein, CIC family